MNDLEKDILKTAQLAIAKSIYENLTGYSNPLGRLVNSVIDKHADNLKELIDSSFRKIILTDEFKSAIDDAFTKKLARTIIDRMEGSIEKHVNEIKSNPVMKAKLIIAVEQIIIGK